MTNKNIKGITIELEGNATGLTDALKDVDKATRTTTSELREIERALKFDPSNVELLAQRQQVLADQIGNTTQRLETLRTAQEQVQQQFERGDISAEQYRAFNREIERTEGQLRSLQQRAAQGVDVTTEADTRGIDRLKSAMDGIPDAAKSAASAASSALTGIGTAAAGALAGVGALTVGMQETNTDLAILNTQLGQVGLSMDQVTAATTNFSVVGQQTDQIVEAMGNLVAAGYTTAEQIDAISQNISGAIVKYGDTFNAEGIGESIALTTELNEASGQLLDLLEREGVNIDAFNAKIAKFGTEAEKAQYITDVLAKQGLADLNAAFQTGNPALVDQAEAQQKLTENLSELSLALTPLLTVMTDFTNVLLDVANGNITLEEAFEQLSTKASELFPQIADEGANAFKGLLEAMQETAPELAEFMQEAVTKILDTLIDNAPEFLDAGIDIVTELLEGLSKTIPEIASKAVELAETLIESIISKLPDILETGGEIVQNLLQGISKVLPELVTAALNLVIQLAKAIVTNLPTIIDTGVKILQALIEGIVMTVGALGKAIVTQVIPNIFKAFLGEDWASIGRDIINGLAKGITNFGKNAVDAITGVVNSVVNKAKSILKTASPSKVFEQIGAWTSEGLAIGIRDELKNVEGAAGELAETVIVAVEKNFGEIERIEKEQAAKLSEIETNATKKINEIQLKAKESKKKITAAQLRQIEQIEQDSAQKVLETETKYNEQILKKRQELESAKFTAVKTFIEEKRKLEQISTLEEARLWEMSLNAFSDNSAAKIEAQIEYKESLNKVFDEITNVNETYSKRISEVNEELIENEKKLTDEYTKQLEERTNQLADTKSIFEEFDQTVEVQGKDLLKNLQSQVDGLKKWEQEFTKLSEKAIDDGLLEQLRQMGPEALGELQALNSLSAEELDKYSVLYQEKVSKAREIAVAELKPLEEDTKNAIQLMRVGASVELEILKDEWATQIRDLTVVSSTELSSMQDVGRYAVQGLMAGMGMEQGSLTEQVRQIAKSIEETTRETLETQSPSLVMTRIGQDIANGLIVGMEQRGEAVTDEARAMAKSIGDAFANAEYVSTDDLIKLNASDALKELATINNSIKGYDYYAKLLDPKEAIEKANKERLKIEEKYADLLARVEKRKADTAEHIQRHNITDEKVLSVLEDGMARDFASEMALYYAELSVVANEEKRAMNVHQEYMNNKLEAQKKFVEQTKKFNNLSLKDEIALYTEFAGMYEKDSEQYQYFANQKIEAQKKLSEAVKKINTEFTAKVKKANDDLIASTQKVETKYSDAYNNIRNNILSATSGFSEFQRQEKIQGNTIVKNLESQIRAVNEYNSVINSLRGRVDDKGFIEYLQTLGPSALSELEALNSLSKDELDYYVSLYNERFEKANNAATIQLQDMRQNADAEIVKLQEETALQLAAYEQEWATAISTITGNVEEGLGTLPQTMEKTGKDIISSLSDGLSNMMPSLTAQLESIANTISQTINSALDMQLDTAQIKATTQRLASAASTVTASMASSTAKSQQAQQATQIINNQATQDNQALVDAVLKLAESPIMTNVSLDGRTIAQAVSGYQYQTAATNALTKGVIL